VIDHVVVISIRSCKVDRGAGPRAPLRGEQRPGMVSPIVFDGDWS
jgi:hypothetical protein